MPLEKEVKGNLADVLVDVGAAVKVAVETDPASLFNVREVTKVIAEAGGKTVDGYLVAIAVGILYSMDEITVEKRTGKVYIGAK